MDDDTAQAIALHRWAVIAEATSDRLEPGRARRAGARRSPRARHAHPDGTERRYSRAAPSTAGSGPGASGGLEALRPGPRSDTGAVRAHPELFAEAAALRLELPSRSAAQIARILLHRHGIARGRAHRARAAAPAGPAPRGAGGRAQGLRPLRGRACQRALDHRRARRTLGARTRRSTSSVRAKLFLIVDDHSRLLVDGAVLRPRERPGLPGAAAPGHHAPGTARRPVCRQRRAVQERLAGPHLCRARACASCTPSPTRPKAGASRSDSTATSARRSWPRPCHRRHRLARAELNDLFVAWAEQVANRRVHAETNETPIDRFEPGGPHRQVDPERLREAFRWSVTRKVTRTATVALEGNAYAVDPALVGRRVELRYDPEDLTRIDVYFEGRPAGVATPFVIGRHTHRAVPQAQRPGPEPTGIDYLGHGGRRPRGGRPAPGRRSTSPSSPCSSRRRRRRAEEAR